MAPFLKAVLLLGICGCGRIDIVLGRRGGEERGVGDDK
jgi:hypothetical protein